MKVLVAISAPDFGKPTGARGAQYQFTNLAATLKLVASRIEMGGADGHFEHAGISASWRVEQSTTPTAKPAEDAAA